MKITPLKEAKILLRKGNVYKLSDFERVFCISQEKADMLRTNIMSSFWLGECKLFRLLLKTNTIERKDSFGFEDTATFNRRLMEKLGTFKTEGCNLFSDTQQKHAPLDKNMLYRHFDFEYSMSELTKKTWGYYVEKIKEYRDGINQLKNKDSKITSFSAFYEINAKLNLLEWLSISIGCLKKVLKTYDNANNSYKDLLKMLPRQERTKSQIKQERDEFCYKMFLDLQSKNSDMTVEKAARIIANNLDISTKEPNQKKKAITPKSIEKIIRHWKQPT